MGLPGATVRRGPVAAVLAIVPPAPVDLVLADPPYEVTAQSVADMLRSLSRYGWVNPGSVVVVERPASAPELDWPAGWTRGRPGGTATPSGSGRGGPRSGSGSAVEHHRMCGPCDSARGFSQWSHVRVA